jgi:hypothetical protein
VDPEDDNTKDENSFGRYLPTDSANSHILTALLSVPATQDAQFAGIGTTKPGYLMKGPNIGQGGPK